MTGLAGVDGCRGGWVVVMDEGVLACHVAPTFADVLGLCTGIVAVDVPVGLLDAGERLCDRLARRALAPRRASSVFSAPIRPALDAATHAATHAAASDARARVEGKRMSIQAYHLLPKICEVDRALREGDTERVFEVHPEVSFARLNGGVPLAHSKKTEAGRTERLALLTSDFGDVPARFVAGPKKDVAADDVLDAFAALWTARRLAAGTAEALPADVPRDAFGLPMAIHV